MLTMTTESPASAAMPGQMPSMSAAPTASPAAGTPSYWPSQLLQAFSLRMSAHGISVNSAMMLGDHGYALARLAQAHTTDDDLLRRVAVELFRFFEHHRAGTARLN